MKGGMTSVWSGMTSVWSGMTSVWSVWSWVTELSVFGAVPVSILALNTRVISETRKISARDLQISSRLTPSCFLT